MRGLPHALPALKTVLATWVWKRLGGPSPRTAAGPRCAEVSGGHRRAPGPGPLSPRPADARLLPRFRAAAANSPILIRTLLFHFDGLVQLAIRGAVLGVGSLHACCVGAAGEVGAAGREELTAAAPLRARRLAFRTH